MSGNDLSLAQLETKMLSFSELLEDRLVSEIRQALSVFADGSHDEAALPLFLAEWLTVAGRIRPRL